MTSPSAIRAASARARCPASLQAAFRLSRWHRALRRPAARQQRCRGTGGRCPGSRAPPAGGRLAGARGPASGTVRPPGSRRSAARCRADQRAEFHHATDHRAASVPSAGSSDSASCRSATDGAGPRQALAGDEPGEHAPHIGVQDRVPLAEGEAGHGRRRIVADARQRAQFCRRSGHLAAVLLGDELALTHAGARPAADSQAGPIAGPRRQALAAASAAGLGHRCSQEACAGSTRLTGVCCSMNSLTRTDHGVASGWRHGRLRALPAYQPSTGP